MKDCDVILKERFLTYGETKDVNKSNLVLLRLFLIHFPLVCDR